MLAVYSDLSVYFCISVCLYIIQNSIIQGPTVSMVSDVNILYL